VERDSQAASVCGYIVLYASLTSMDMFSLCASLVPQAGKPLILVLDPI
jgi:hypothetical protein